MRRRGGGNPEGPAGDMSPRLDRLDLKILATLQEAGRITNLELADTIGLSATPCLQRVRRLEAAGYIRGYGAALAIDRLCATIMVFTEITLRHHRREDFLRFERAIQAVPHILDAYLVSGGYDYLVQFIAKDILDYQSVVESLLDRDLGIEKYFSYVAIKQVKRSAGYPIAVLMPPPEA
jgi:DNA-binding Lrp family transcriptional regulator